MPAVAAGRWLTRRAGARGVCALAEKTHRRIVEKLATICCKLQALLCCWSCCLVVVRKPQQRLVFHLFSLHSNSSCNSCLGNAIEQEFHIVFTASRRCCERGTLAEPGSILSVKTVACWQQGRVQFFRISQGNWRSCSVQSAKYRLCFWRETENLMRLNKILYLRWHTKDRTS